MLKKEELKLSSTVYFADMRASQGENMFARIGRLLFLCSIDEKIARDDLVAVKVHFGERGNHSFIRPVFVRKVVEVIKGCGGKPFLTDSSTLYPGERKEAVSSLTCAIENGFAYAVVGAPLVMSDGLRGHTAKDVEIDGELLGRVSIGADVVESDALVVLSHFKCHELTGFGGALKNTGMGCASREGKMEQHSTIAPRVAVRYCDGCGYCLKACVHGAIRIHDGSAGIDQGKCVGCGRCVTVCPRKAINIQWNEAGPMVMRKICEYALGVMKGKESKSVFVNFITQVSPDCDCYGHSDAPIVPDLGICASTDPVALDQACADLVNAAQGLRDSALQTGREPGGDKFRGAHPGVEWEVQLKHGEKLGLGSREYRLQRI
jgi:uncharacterized Fe-S center protein